MDVIRILCAGAHQHLRSPGLFACEIDAVTSDRVIRLLEEAAPWRHVEIVHDLQSLPRVVVAEKS